MKNEFDFSPNATIRAMVESIIRTADILRENEPDHDTAVLVRKIKESK